MGPVVNLSLKAYFPLNNHSIPTYIISPPTVIFFKYKFVDARI